MITGRSYNVVTSYSLSDEPVIMNRLKPFINDMKSRGYSIRIFGPEVLEGSYSGATFIKVRKNLKKSGFLSRAISEIGYSFRMRAILRKYVAKDDLIFVSIPSMFLILTFPFLKCKTKILDIRDLTWEYLNDKKVMNYLFKRFFRCLFHFCTKFSDVITVTNPKELSYVKLNSNNASTFLVTNGILKEQYDKLSYISASTRARDGVAISYIGNVGVAQDLSTFVMVAKEYPDIQFNIIGSGTDFFRVKQVIEDLKLANVYMPGRKSWEQLLKIYDDSSLLYAQLTSEFSTAIPSKLYEYFSAGKPIVYGGDSSIESNFKDFTGVRFIKPSCIKALCSAVDDYISKCDSYRVDIEHNRNLIRENYLRELAVAKFHTSMGF